MYLRMPYLKRLHRRMMAAPIFVMVLNGAVEYLAMDCPPSTGYWKINHLIISRFLNMTTAAEVPAL